MRESQETVRTGTRPAASTAKALDEANYLWRFAFGILAFLALFVALLVLLPIAPTVAAAPSPPTSLLALFVAMGHVLVVFAGSLLIWAQSGFFTGREDALPRSPTARHAWQQLLGGISYLSLAWANLYLALFTSWGDSPRFGGWLHGPRGLAIADAWNTLASLSFFYLYLVLDQPSVRSEDDAERDTGFLRAFMQVSLLCGTVALLSLVGRFGWLGLERLGPFAGSLLGAVSMMYFFGKFDYRYMRVKRLWIAPLYVYVAIQTAWHEIAPGAGWYADGLFLAALLLKAYFFGLVWYWIRNRTLQRYLDFASL